MATSRELFERAKAILPGGVNSPVRAFGSVGGEPPFIAAGEGCRLRDVDGREYIDYVGSWGPLILGHAHPRVVEAVREAAGRGLSFGACHENEIRLAEAIRDAMPHLQQLRLVNSGTEAAMTALRLARGATGRDGVVKFRGCYHGHADSFLIAAGSGALTFGTPSSPGVTAGAAGDTLLAEYNDLASVERLFAEHDAKIAAVIVEPVAGNMGVVPPVEGFLEGLRTLCDAHGAVLIFDEVITGFRVAPGGAAERYGVTPDLTVLGKIIGGGMPVGAFGGRRDLMEQLSPVGPVYQAGTLSGNPLACAAGLATLQVLREDPPYARLEAMAQRYLAGTEENLRAAGVIGCVNGVGSMSTLFLGCEAVCTFAETQQADTDAYARYHGAMLSQNVYLAPSQFEAAFLSTAHAEADLDQTLAAQRVALDAARAG